MSESDFLWTPIGMHHVIADSSGRVVAKVLLTHEQHRPNCPPVPAKAWVFGKFIGEYVNSDMAKREAERWVRLGPPAV